MKKSTIMLKKNYKQMIAVVAFLLAGGSAAIAQQNEDFTGTVRDASGEPLQGVTVRVDGVSDFIATDKAGRFYVSIPAGVKTVTCSYIGYKDLSLPVNGSEADVRMVEDASCSDELLEIAANRVEKRLSYTGAISTVKNEELQMTVDNGLEAAMKGKLAGYYSSDNIRGLSSPNGAAILYVLDGVPAPTLDLNTIDPRTVESVSILKDAAAKALYGPLGAQGVILVTTKKGIVGKQRVNVNMNFAIEAPTYKADMLNSLEYATLRNQALANDGLTAAFSQSQLDAFADGTGIDNDWRKMFLKNSRLSQRYNVEISGGNNKVKYYVNGGFERVDGMYKVAETEKCNPSNYDNRFNLMSNIDVNVFKFMNVFLNTDVRVNRVNNTRGSNIITKIYSTPNTVEGPLTEDGKILTDENFNNPIYGEINRVGMVQQTATDVNASFGMNFDLSMITKGLSARGLVGYHSYYVGNLNASNTYARYVRDVNGDIVQMGSTVDGVLTYSKGASTVYFMNFQAFLEYDRQFGKHSFNAFVNYLAEDKLGSSYSSGWLLPFRRIQLGGHAKYGYDNRYFVQLDFTHAGSEQMKKGNQFHFSPTGSLAWVVSNEDFMKEQSFVNLLKIRASYGALEYDNLWNFPSRYLYGTEVRQLDGAGLVHSLYTAAYIGEGNVGNAEIKWEKSYQQNYGIDLSVLNALNLSVDYWRTNQHGVLTQSEITPSLSGLSSSNLAYVNVGRVVNQGVDFEANYTKSLKCGLDISATGDFGWNTNKITEIAELNRASGYYYPYRKTGYSIGQKFGYLVDTSNGNGFFNSQSEIDASGLKYQGTAPRVGDLIYQDLNGDKLIDECDKAPLDGVKDSPSFNFGASVQLKYKNFDLYIQLQGETGRNAYYNGLGVWENKSQGVYLAMHQNAWTAERYAAGEAIEYPALTSTSSSSLCANSFFVSKADYLRLKNVTLGYSLPKNVIEKMHLNQLRFYVTGQNLLTATNLKFKGFDPESTSIDSFVYRMFNLGVNINF